MDPTGAAILTGLCVGTFGALLPGPLSRALIARADVTESSPDRHAERRDVA